MRRAGSDDLAKLTALQHAAYAPNRAILGVVPIPLQADYADVLATKEVWVTGDDGHLDGALILEHDADRLLIWSIATDPVGQQRGLGRSMLDAAELRARQLGLPMIKLYTGTRLDHLVGWYGRHGYMVECIEQRSDRSITHMQKILAK